MRGALDGLTCREMAGGTSLSDGCEPHRSGQLVSDQEKVGKPRTLSGFTGFE